MKKRSQRREKELLKSQMGLPLSPFFFLQSTTKQKGLRWGNCKMRKLKSIDVFLNEKEKSKERKRVVEITDGSPSISFFLSTEYWSGDRNLKLVRRPRLEAWTETAT
uniref:Uncharacterized protein n=1 Tax=Populus davidiana TaxID=266767 RepID=A0A6M2EH37_9ROSI